MSEKKTDKLTRFEAEFIEQYFQQGGNATKAYQRTSEIIKEKEVKYDSAKVNGCKYKKRLQNYIEERQKELRLKDGKIIDSILYLLQRTLFYNIDNVISVKDNQTYVKDSKEWTDIDRLLINNIEPGRNGLKVDFIDKKWAISMLLKIYYGMINENTTEAGGLNTGLEGKTNEEIFELLKALEDEENE